MRINKGTTKSHGKKHPEDKFYTADHIAKLCLELIDVESYSVKIEPSAGSGSFSNRVPDCIAFDTSPEHDSIIKQNWLEYSRERDCDQRVLVVGNPPFGVQNNMAIKFINHAAKFADTIAFILPRSFKKESIQSKLDPNLHLREELILPKNSFMLRGEPYDLPAVFQIWDYDKSRIRPLPMKHVPEGYSWVKKSESPNISIQRIGGNAGKAKLDCENSSIQSHYFIKLDNPEVAETVVSLINENEFPTRYDSVGPRSISKNEFTPVVNAYISRVIHSL